MAFLLKIKMWEIILPDPVYIYIYMYMYIYQSATHYAHVTLFRAVRSNHFPSILVNERNVERNPLTRHVLCCTNSLARRSSI